MKTETFLAVTSSSTVAIYAAIVLTRFEKWGGLSLVAWNPESKSEVFLSRGVRLFVDVPDLGWLMTLALLVVASPLVCYGLARWKKNDSFLMLANRAVFLSILLQVMALAMFLMRAHDGRYASLDADGLFPTSLAASPFILSGLVGGVFISLLYLLLLWRRPDLERLLPSSDNLDRITYKTISLCLPPLNSDDCFGSILGEPDLGLLLELRIAKETWAAITWLVYAGYLHMRITRGWRGRRAAYSRFWASSW